MITAAKAKENIKNKSKLESLLEIYNIESSIVNASNNRKHSVYIPLDDEYASRDYDILSDYLIDFGYTCHSDKGCNYTSFLVIGG